MEIYIAADKQEGGAIAFDCLSHEITENGAETLGLATGSTPLSLYEKMVASDLDFSQMTSVNLDEYVGLNSDHPQSYHYFMNEHLFSKKPFKKSYVPDGSKPEKEATESYDAIIAAHPIDVQILGLGQNGHIAFNEPGTSFDSTTHKVSLTENTIQANKRFFADEKDVPREAYSMGIQSIMSAKTIILMAYGEQKSKAVKAMIEGPVTEELPASILQKHDHAIIIVDKAAAALLSDTVSFANK